jgi:hypothetical protein
MGQSATYSTSNSPREYAPFTGFFPLTISGTSVNAPANPTNASQFIEFRSSINGAEDTSGLGGSVVYHFDPSSLEWTTETHIRMKYIPYGVLFGVLFGNQGYPVLPLMAKIVASPESPNYYQGVYTLLDKSTAETVSAWTPSIFPSLSVEDSREASEEEAWAAYKEIEPRIRNVLNLLADS